MSISLPEEMKRWVERQCGHGRFEDPSDYVRDLIRRDQARQAKIAHMQSLIGEGLASGKSQRSMADIKVEASRRAVG